MGTSYNSNIVTDGLVLCLDAANPRSYPLSGNTWYDLSGNGYNGTLQNGPTFSSANRGAMSFDGTNDYVSFADTTIGSFNNATLSYGAWFYFDGTSQEGIIVAKRNDNPYNQYSMAISNHPSNGGSGTNFNAFANTDQNQGGYMMFSYSLSSTGAGWYYGFIVINNNNQTMFVNGKPVRFLTQAYSGKTFNMTNKPLYVGATNLNNSPAVFFDNKISIVYLYNRALSASEVLQNYNATRGRYGY